jgi:hypothetical protein
MTSVLTTALEIWIITALIFRRKSDSKIHIGTPKRKRSMLDAGAGG